MENTWLKRKISELSAFLTDEYLEAAFNVTWCCFFINGIGLQKQPILLNFQIPSEWSEARWICWCYGPETRKRFALYNQGSWSVNSDRSLNSLCYWQWVAWFLQVLWPPATSKLVTLNCLYVWKWLCVVVCLCMLALWWTSPLTAQTPPQHQDPWCNEPRFSLRWASSCFYAAVHAVPAAYSSLNFSSSS